MAAKLKSVLENFLQRHRSQWWLFLKTAVFAIALFLASLGGFGPADLLFFLAVSSFLYFRPLFGHYPTIFGFLVLLPAAAIGMEILRGSVFFLGGIAVFSLIFCLFLGIKDYAFVKRDRLYYIAAFLLFYAIFIEFFFADKSEWFLLKYGLTAIAAFLIFREWLRIISVFSFPKREVLAAAAASLLTAQALWVVALLPIGFISSANFMVLLVFVMANFLLKHFLGGISKDFLIQQLIFFVLLGTLIFWTSRWTLVL